MVVDGSTTGGSVPISDCQPSADVSSTGDTVEGTLVTRILARLQDPEHSFTVRAGAGSKAGGRLQEVIFIHTSQ